LERPPADFISFENLFQPSQKWFVAIFALVLSGDYHSIIVVAV
jgi:hypothetical protein